MTTLTHSTSPQNGASRIAFWGTLVHAATLLIISLMVIYLSLSGTNGPTGTVAYIVTFFMVVIATMNMASLVFTARGNQSTGYLLTYLTLMVFGLSVMALIQGRAIFLSFSLLILTFVGIGWLCPPRSKRSYLIATAITFALIWAIEWINPSWRAEYTGAQLGPIATIIFGVIFALLVALQAWGRSMRNKLMISFIGVTLVATGVLAVYVYTSTTNILRNGLEGELTQHTDGVANSIGNLINEQVNILTTLSMNEALQNTVDEANNSYRGDTIAIQTTLGVRDAKWRAADAADNNNDPLVRENLSNQAALELKEFQLAFPNHAEVFVTDTYGGLTGTTNRTSDYYQADEEWWQAAYNNGEGAVFIGEPEFDESAGALAVQIALPIRNPQNGKITGVIRTTYLAAALDSILREPVGVTGETDLFIPGEVLSHFHNGQYLPVEEEELNALGTTGGQGMVEINYDGVASVVLQSPVQAWEGDPAVDDLGWVVLFHQTQDEAFAPADVQTRGTLIVMAIVVAFAVAAAFGLSLFLVRPIAQLTQTAEEIASGNLDSRAKVVGTDEVGILASTFNSMTFQLQETLQGLEQRVADRTRDLEIVAEVSTATSTILESKRLLQEVVDLTKERFSLYHSHIYLLDEKGENLVLTAGAGEPGRVMVAEGRSIPLDREQSLVARAAREQKGVTVNDVTQAPDFLPNPLLPETRSELAVPMIVGGNVIGVFDIQSEQIGRFTDADINIQTTLAAQLATSIQNVRSFEQSKRQAELESMVNVIGQKIQRTTSIEETLQTAIRELGTAIGASRMKVTISASKDGGNS